MAFTILFAALALLVLMIVFGVIYKLRGLRTAFLATAAAVLLFVLIYVAMIYVISAGM